MNTAPSQFLHVTCVSLGERSVHVVARCDLCDVVAERTLDGWPDEAELNVAVFEGLALRGCKHADSVTGTGARRAFRRSG